MTEATPTGRLRLTATVRHGRTVLSEVYRTAPFHPGPLHHRGERATVIVQEVSPGILPGDRLAIDIGVEQGASLSVVGQSAVKIFSSPHGIPAKSTTSLAVAAGGSLWWLPGDLIPYREARYESRLHIRLDPGATFALLEVGTPGRMAMAERHAYARLDLRLRLDVAGRPLLIERTILDPRERPGQWGGTTAASCWGALTLVGYHLPDPVDADESELWLGGDGGPELAIVRGIAARADCLRETLLSVLRRATAAPVGGPAAPHGAA